MFRRKVIKERINTGEVFKRFVVIREKVFEIIREPEWVCNEMVSNVYMVNFLVKGWRFFWKDMAKRLGGRQVLENLFLCAWGDCQKRGRKVGGSDWWRVSDLFYFLKN